ATLGALELAVDAQTGLDRPLDQRLAAEPGRLAAHGQLVTRAEGGAGEHDFLEEARPLKALHEEGAALLGEEPPRAVKRAAKGERVLAAGGVVGQAKAAGAATTHRLTGRTAQRESRLEQRMLALEDVAPFEDERLGQRRGDDVGQPQRFGQGLERAAI